MTAVFHGLKAAAVDFRKESLSACDPFDVTYLPFYNSAFAGLARGENLRDPALRGEVFGELCHAPILPRAG